MSKIIPFKGVRPRVDLVSEIAALPYDVYSTKEARMQIEDKPLSFLRIDRAETLFPEGTSPYESFVYEKARDTLYEMLQRKEFIQDERECFYIYRLTMNGRSQTGLVACASMDEYIEGSIKKHELTRADKEKDRINHVDYCDAQTGPIFLTYRGKKEIDEMVEKWMENHICEFDFTAEDKVRHEAWVVDSKEMIEQIASAFQTVDSLYIADGHHRAASAVKVGLKRREENPTDFVDRPYNFFLSVIFPSDQLQIMDYNRVVKDLKGLSKEAFLERIQDNFELLKTSNEQIKPSKKGMFSMFLGGTWYLLEARKGTYDEKDPVLSLDVSILQKNLLEPVLGIEDPRTDERIDFVGGIRGLQELERRVKEDMTVAFALYPTSLEELMGIADANALMPPKSTWFEPKLRSGLFIHLLRE